jgi:predicted metal-dependent phosphoesterase TrpH
VYWKLSYRSRQIKKSDLHVHTTASDGKYKPREIVRLAAGKSISFLAITDHDTLSGLQEAHEECIKYRLNFIPGVELSTSYEENEIHLLGYNIDRTSIPLNAALTKLQDARKQRIEGMIGKLADGGIPITIQAVQNKSAGSSIGRPHIALVLKELGLVSSIDEGIKKYLSPGCPAYLPRHRLSPFEAIDLIKEAHGIPVLAHPGISTPLELIPVLINYGLKGIEVFHPKHTAKQIAFYLHLIDTTAKSLLITGGSDFHGYEKTDQANFGAMKVPLRTIRALQKLKVQLRQKKYS